MNYTKNEKKYYDASYWFDNKEHDVVDNYGKNYYANTIYKNVILKLEDIPLSGKIVLLGTNRCVAFNLLCDRFGIERCLGYDIANPTNHPSVIVKDCTSLNNSDNVPIAFCHNDIGSFPTTPKLKIYCQEWSAKNVILGGYYLGRNNLNRAKYNSEEYMESLGFVNYHFKDLVDKFDMSNFEDSWIEGHMLSKRLEVK